MDLLCVLALSDAGLRAVIAEKGLVALSLLNGAVYIGVLLSRSRHARRVEVYAKSAAAPALRGVAAPLLRARGA